MSGEPCRSHEWVWVMSEWGASGWVSRVGGGHEWVGSQVGEGHEWMEAGVGSHEWVGIKSVGAHVCVGHEWVGVTTWQP